MSFDDGVPSTAGSEMDFELLALCHEGRAALVVGGFAVGIEAVGKNLCTVVAR